MLSRRRSLYIADNVLDDAGRCSNAVIASESLNDLISSRRSSLTASNKLGCFREVEMLVVAIALYLMCMFVSWKRCRIPSSGSDVLDGRCTSHRQHD